MPELPEVETVVQELKARLTGKTITGVEADFLSCLETPPENYRRAVCGRRLHEIFRRGKYICFELDQGPVFTVHLRMTGKLLFQLPEGERKHLRLSWCFADGSGLHFLDVRKFGRVRLWPGRSALLPKLGPEPLDPQTIVTALTSGGKRAVKALLLDQHVLAGIGNIYADESLFLSGIHPSQPIDRLSRARCRKLANSVVGILQSAIANMGTTLSDYRTTRNENGRHGDFLQAYGRTGLPCLHCGTPLQRAVIASRSSHFCPRCQKIR